MSNVDKFDMLPEIKQRAIEMLVIGNPVTNKPYKYGEIAEACGVAEMTLRRWRADSEFNAARKEFRERFIKPELLDEAARTIMRGMRNKDSTAAAELALKWSGELIERRATEVTGNVTQQIDVRDSSHQALMDRLKTLHQQLGLPDDVELYIGQTNVVAGEIVGESDDDDDSNDKNEPN